MSRDHLDNSGLETSLVTANRLLLLLKNRGPQTSADLGQLLGTTGEAARQQLLKLAEAELVISTSESRGVGRPVQVWSITPKGHARFPDTHSELTVQLIDAVRSTLGEQALDQLISAREQKMLGNYTEAMNGAKKLGDRLAILAAVRSKEGYMAEWRTEGKGFLFIENHCPICAAAKSCANFCRSELDLFSKLLPGASVTRAEHILNGERRCVYRISQGKSTKKRAATN